MESNSSRRNRPNLLIELGLESISDVVLLALQCLRSGNYQHAIQLCSAGCERYGNDTAAAVVSAMAELGMGEVGRAETLLSAVRSAHPTHLVSLYTLAWLHAESGDTALAVKELLAVIRAYPDYPGALGALSTFHMPGPSYRDVLGYVHQVLAPKTYLEIGVETGATLRLAQSAELAVGIDPNLVAVRKSEIKGQVRLYETTSDEFFTAHTCASVFDGRPLDLAFIDGMHRFEYAIRDFCNVESWSNPNTVVVLHDVLPVHPIVAERERQTKFWVGDTWKVLWLLVERRQDLTISVIPTPPSGLAIIRGLNREHKCDPAHFGNTIEHYAGLTYPSLEPGTWPGHLRLVANTRAGWNSALFMSEKSS